MSTRVYDGGLVLSPEEEKRLADLFNRIDINKDGKIDISDLTTALHYMQVPQFPGQAQQWMAQYDKDKDGIVTFSDFVKYVMEHEKALRLSFERVDHNKDGLIDTDEIMQAFSKMGVHIDRAEAEKLLKRMDKDETLMINWNEWREYLLLNPSSDMHDIVHYWRHATIIDVGEDSLIPDDFTESELHTGMWWRHLAAGAAAGMVSRTCTAPLDRLKVMLQVHGSRKSHLGIVSGFRYMLKEGGVVSLWRGNGINVLKIAPESALKFMAYEQIKRSMKSGFDRDLGISERFLAGSLAGAFSQSAIYPMEVLKTRLALRKTGQYTGMMDCAHKIYLEGISSFYRGYIPNVLGIIPYAGIDLAVYETLKRLYIQNHSAGQDPGILVLLACGTLSSTCGQLASYPLALVRTKLQAKVTPLGSQDTMTGLFRVILKNEGIRGLYRGITPNFMKVAPAVSISYVVYEHVRKLLGVEMS